MSILIDKRLELNMTQKQLANKIGVSRSAIAKWELGLAFPNTAKLSHVAKVYGLTEREIIAAITAAKKETPGERARMLDGDS